MKIATAVDTLHRASGIALTEIQAIAKDLKCNGVITVFDGELSSHDAALLALRAIAPHIELPAFVSDIAEAALVGARIYNDDGGGFDVIGDDLARNTYTQNQWCVGLAETIGEHIEAIASNEANRSDYQTVLSITVCETGEAISVGLVLRFDGLGFKQPVTCILVYGDGSAYFGGAQGRQHSISTDVFDALGEALANSWQWPLTTEFDPVINLTTTETLH